MERVLVTGKMRSGTTFIANLLNSQDGGVVYSDFIRSPFIQGQKLGITDARKPLTDTQKNVLSAELEAEFNFNGYQIIIERDGFNTWEEFFNLALDKMLDLDDLKEDQLHFLGVKKTEELFYLEELLRTGYKVIYMHRDPRDVLLSSKNRFANYNLSAYLYHWKKSINKALKCAKHPSFLMLGFEDLIAKDKDALQALNEFLNYPVNFDLVSLSRHNKEEKYTNNSSFGDVKGLFDKTALFRWKNKADSDEVLLSSLILKDEIKKLGYECLPAPFTIKSLRLRVKYWIQKVKIYIVLIGRKILKV